MRKSTPIAITGIAAATGLAAAPAAANDMTITVEIPRLRVAEYHNPYVAIWIEDAAGKAVANLDVWYDVDLKGTEEGTKWLSDLRLWWRRAGRSLKMPVNGVSGPTQAPGSYELKFTEGRKPLSKLPAGSYKLQVEAAREVGGREVVTIPFQWPPSGSKTASAKGSSELGTIRLTIKP
ncbi:hypothetical protein FHS61_000012 [Altererythrobacter atlanticus]|uniref:Uncharacterized protein n=1 Tax=Croceibacterium atlanticum TaxID=1267766 RepID=A0A0F7KP02_9SPHN|nr:DUF2271 domain-containing protein [Croceibacterium atlanticum]AKH42243.1 hypothetical protein WYH_01198 [Croceibacterium atlanticum]MBB5731019.1 hypothetical protein [Croceibacterium atlanticum]